MASKVFLLAIVLAAVASSECRPKTSKSFSNYGMHSDQPSWASGEVVNDSPILSKYGNAKNNPSDNDSFSSESQEGHSQLSLGIGHMNQLNVYSLRRNLQRKNSNEPSQWQNYQRDQQRSSEEYQQQRQDQGQGYGSGSTMQHQYHYQQTQFLNQESSPESKPLQVQISGWQNPNQQSSEGNSQKYSFPRQVPQKANSDESSSSSSEEGSQERGYQREQAQARNQMSNKSNQQSSQQQSNDQINPHGLDVSQPQSFKESMEIQKANKIIVKHGIGEVLGRTVPNQQRSRVTLTSSEEETEKEITSGGRNAIYSI